MTGSTPAAPAAEAAEASASRPPRVLLVCSSGGHLLQMQMLQGPLWSRFDRSWVCFDKADARSLLRDERVTWAHHPTNRNVANLLRNARLAWRLLRRERPDCVVSTGAGVALPFLLLGRLLGARTVYLESFARRSDLSLTGRLCYPFVHHFLVQSETLARRHRRAVHLGTVY